MSLRTQIAGLLLLLSCIVIGISYSVQTWVILPAFANLEKSTAERNVARCVDALEAQIAAIASTAHDWSAWDDNYLYVQGKNPDFQAGNLLPESFSNTGLNLICVVNSQRQIVWGQSRDFETQEPIDVPDLFQLITSDSSPLTGWTELEKQATGILQTSQGPIMISSRPILTTKHQGPVQGWMIMGRFLSESQITLLAERTHCSMNAWQLDSADFPLEERDIYREMGNADHPFLKFVGPNQLDGYVVYQDLASKPALLIKVSLDREVMIQGRTSAGIATACNLLGGLLILAAMWIVLSRQIVQPLQRVAKHAWQLGASGNLKARLNFQRRDEIGILADQFDEMVENLAESRRKVLDHAHRAGMAETAAEVLHNVGNAVNSANCCVESLSDSLRTSKLPGINRALELLRQAGTNAAEFFQNDARAPKLFEYFEQLSTALERERTNNSREVDRLRNTIRHIRDAITLQQSVAVQATFPQETTLHELFEEVWSIIEPKLIRHNIHLIADLEGTKEICLNKNRMVQVLINLLRNGIQAMAGLEHPKKELTVVARVQSGTLQIDVSDTGTGFDESIRDQLFVQGFTTKEGGSGLGLHFCANAVHEAGGSITARSEGPGKGAMFTIRLPVSAPQTAQHDPSISLLGVSNHAS